MEIQEIEKQFKELIDISSYMLKKNKEMDELMQVAPDGGNVPGSEGRVSLTRSDRMQAASANDVEKTNLLA